MNEYLVLIESCLPNGRYLGPCRRFRVMADDERAAAEQAAGLLQLEDGFEAREAYVYPYAEPRQFRLGPAAQWQVTGERK